MFERRICLLITKLKGKNEMKKIDSKWSRINDAYVRKNAKKISGQDIEKVAGKADEIRDKVKNAGLKFQTRFLKELILK